jgi:hypothetical protein
VIAVLLIWREVVDDCTAASWYFAAGDPINAAVAVASAASLLESLSLTEAATQFRSDLPT